MTKKDLGNTNGEKIENLNLVALRKYACPKIMNEKEWYMKCMDCPTIGMCKTGERVKELLEKETAPVTTAKKIHTILSSKWVNAAYHILALEQKDPIGWYAERRTKGNRREAASLLRSFKKNCGIAPGEILTRDNFVIAHPKYKNTGKPAAEIIAELEKKGKLNIQDGKNMENGRIAAPGGDFDGDKISIADFLKEGDPEIGKATNLVIDAAKSVMTKPYISTPLKPFAIDHVEMKKGFDAKRRWLKDELAKNGKQLKELQARQAKLENDIHTLDAAAVLFGLIPKNE